MLPSTLSDAQEARLNAIVSALSSDPRFIAISASGSFASNQLDRYSDLDLTLVIEPDAYEEVMASRFHILENIDGITACFTGEHVGEPRLVISIFSPDAIHVDFKFASLDDAAVRVDDPVIVWERDTRYRGRLDASTASYPYPEPQWLEDRIWIWVHYAATKIARGEYFESLDFLSFIRNTVLGPIAQRKNGLTPTGESKLEERLPEFAVELKGTVAGTDRQSLTEALRKCIEIYEDLIANESVERNEDVRTLCSSYVDAELDG